MAETCSIVGIDEAGYGPILGPLVVSAVAFEVPRADAARCLWEILGRVVTRKPASSSERICVADSKKLYSPKKGLARLERTVLSAVSAWRGPPPTVSGLLRLVAPDVSPLLAEYPWYRQADIDLPLSADRGAVRIDAALFAAGLQRAGVRITGIYSEVLPEGHYNRLVGSTDNKAVVLSGLMLRLVQRVSETRPNGEIHFYVDKHGGRDHYGSMLRRSFEDRRLRILHEDRQCSEYELVRGTSETGGGNWRIAFRESGESHHMAVALASCVSKYLREVFMHALNAYWNARAPDLRPTAGYYTDGQRFLRDLRTRVPAGEVNESLMVRRR